MAFIPPAFDWQFYINNYADLKDILKFEIEAKNHYLTVGFYERRKYCNIYDNFNWKEYISRYYSIGTNQDHITTKEDAIYHQINNNQDQVINTPLYQARINIVYYIYINPNKNWQNILKGQLFDLHQTTILEKNKLYIVICCDDSNNINNALSIIHIVLNQYIHNVDVSIEHKNHYEYYGIKKVYDLACQDKNSIFIYFHSKGMVFNNSNDGRSDTEIKLTRHTLCNWENVLYVFETQKNISKAGLFPGHGGFVWFNFWWARGNYIASQSEPIITDNRYYYEHWLKNNTWTDCYCIKDKNISWFKPADACIEVAKLL